MAPETIKLLITLIHKQHAENRKFIRNLEERLRIMKTLESLEEADRLSLMQDLKLSNEDINQFKEKLSSLKAMEKSLDHAKKELRQLSLKAKA